jgi:predicted TIM-barrel fold metal-dependent hydrolase
VPDSALLSEIFRGYNDWLAEFCAGEPKRLKGIAMINVDDVQEGVKELERCAKMGLAGGMCSSASENRVALAGNSPVSMR